MILTPKIELNDRQFLALQELAMKQEMTVEQLIERNVVMLAVKEITSNSHPREWILDTIKREQSENA